MSGSVALPGVGRVSDRAVLGILLAAITGVGVVFRLILMEDSLFADELSTFFVVNQDFSGMWFQVKSPQELTPPLYFVLAWLASKLGSDPTLLRLPSVLAGVASIPLVYLLGSMTLGRRAAIVGAAITSLSPLMIYYSAEARAYALLTFLVLCSAIVLLLALDRGSPGWWVLYAVLLAATMYTHYTGVFVIAAQTVWAFAVAPKARKAICLSVALSVVLWAPWIGQYLADALNPNVDVVGKLHPFGPRIAVEDYLQFMIGVGLPVPTFEVPGPWPIAIFGAGILVALIALWREGFSRPSQRTVLILVLAAATPVGAALSSLVGPDTYVPRTLLISYPGFALVVAALVSSRQGLVAVVATTLTLAGLLMAAVTTTYDSSRRPDYGAVVSFIERYGKPGDPIVDAAVMVPGAWQPIEAELGIDSVWVRERPPYRVGVPSLKEALEVRQPGGPSQFALGLTGGVLSSARLAREVESNASRGRFFLVLNTTYDGPLGKDVNTATGRFLLALPKGFRVVRREANESIQMLGPSVYEIALPPR